VTSQPHDTCITLAGVKLLPRIGVTPGERRQPQPCEADIDIWGDFDAAAATDSLAKAVDYAAVLETVDQAAHQEEFNLVETLARRLARSVLERFPVTRVIVKVRKYPASLASRVAYIEVSREES